LRTQLDLFEKVVPDLANHFTVYALDYPGHGYSDIPKVQYDADFFVRSVEGFLDVLDLREATLCGVSIGGAIADHRRTAQCACRPRGAINPYDYAKGRGMARSSLLGSMITMTSQIPVIGETVMRLRNFAIMKVVLEGGVVNPASIRPALLEEFYEGNRRCHYRAFIGLLRNAASWEAATEAYGNINVPVYLIWCGEDWATSKERDHHQSLLPSAQMATVENGGHFLPLDRPKEVLELIIRFARQLSATRLR
jgi:pimeloyl-ACP methyl ester carboxylesterase